MMCMYVDICRLIKLNRAKTNPSPFDHILLTQFWQTRGIARRRLFSFSLSLSLSLSFYIGVVIRKYTYIFANKNYGGTLNRMCKKPIDHNNHSFKFSRFNSLAYNLLSLYKLRVSHVM